MIRIPSFNSVPVLCFTRWRHHHAAAFRTIGKIVRIGVLPIIYTLLTFGQRAFAQPDSLLLLQQHTIDSVLIERARVQTAFAHERGTVRIISGADLNLPATPSLQDVLAAVPGIDIRQRGAHGIQADLSVRGGSFDQTQILLNGIDLTDAQTGHHNLNLPVHPEAIERIEVLTGPGARLYGPGAYAGAINIVTKTGRMPSTHIAAKGGQYGLAEAFVGTGHCTEQLALYAYAAGATSNGFRPNTDYQKGDFLITGTLATRTGQLALTAAHQAKAFGANAFYTPKFPNQFEAIRSTIASATYRGAMGPWRYEAAAAHRSHRDRFELFRDHAPQWYKAHNHHFTQLYWTRGMIAYTAGISTTSLAIIGRHDEILSTNLGAPLARPRRIALTDSTAYTHWGTRTAGTLSLAERLTLGPVTLALGGMLSRSSGFGWATGYGIDLSYLTGYGLRLYASGNKSYRLPTFTDLYYTAPTQRGNPNLRPEAAYATEAGCNYANAYLSVTAAGYYRAGRNIIDWVRDPSNEDRWIAANHAQANAAGGELTIGYYPRLAWLTSLHAAYAYNHVGSPTPRPQGGSYAFDNLTHSASLRAVVPIWRLFTVDAALRYSQRAGTYIEYTTKTPTSYPPALTLDLRAARQWQQWTFFVEAANVLDARLVDLGNVPLPGRWVSAGASFTLNH